jgi:hypothetical protein
MFHANYLVLTFLTYLQDQIADNFAHIPHLPKFEPFSRAFVMYSAYFSHEFKNSFDEHFFAYKDHQHRIPVYGAALLTPDLSKVLLLSSFRSNSVYGFPKGKINQNEDEVDCALREM